MRIDAMVLAAGLALAAGAAAACGYCIEDRIAAVYDHSVVERAKRANLEIAFFAIEGQPGPGDTAGAALRAALEEGGGVKRTARVSLASAACSVAYDPAKVSLGELVARSNRALSTRGLALVELRPGRP